MNNQVVKIAAFALAGIVLFAASFFLFAVLSGTKLDELAVVGGMFASEETAEVAEGDPEPDPTIELQEDERPEEAVLHSATTPLQAFLVQSPFSNDELEALQVFIEAAACGTPAIAYPVGGVEEAVVPGVTGLLATEVHPSALADQIEKLYLLPELRKKMAVWGRIEVENEWSYRSSSVFFRHEQEQRRLHHRMSLQAINSIKKKKTHKTKKKSSTTVLHTR